MLVDQETVERAARGDAEAFGTVVTAYRARVIATIARMICRPDDAEDVAQDVFARLYFTFDQLRAPQVFEFWLHRMTVNAAYSYLRRPRRKREFSEADLGELQLAQADAAQSHRAEWEKRRRQRLRDEVERALSVVSQADRILLILKEVEGLSLQDLEKVYGVSENAMKVRLFRARKRVQKALAGKPGQGAGAWAPQAAHAG